MANKWKEVLLLALHGKAVNSQGMADPICMLAFEELLRLYNLYEKSEINLTENPGEEKTSGVVLSMVPDEDGETGDDK